MAKILVLFAHPALEKSRVHTRMLRQVQQLKGITVNDLYEEYPDFDIDIEREQELLLKHDIIVWQHPFYWYSAPALVKQWIDLVFEHGWAYGRHGTALKNKKIFNAISSGGSKQAYNAEGINRYSIRQYLRPFEQTARLCNMTYLPPYIIHGTHQMSVEEMDRHAESYMSLLKRLQTDLFSDYELGNTPYLNDLLPDID